MFLNETLHPEAADLFDSIMSCTRTPGEDAFFYVPLETWRVGKGLSDEATSDLYARVEEAFAAQPIHSLTRMSATSLMSKCLWQNHKEFPHG